LSGRKENLVIVGQFSGRHGSSLYQKYAERTGVKFLGGIFDRAILKDLRHFAAASIHGHSVGGTNPSLLESMAAGSPVIAHDNPYNRWVLGDESDYFRSAEELSEFLKSFSVHEKKASVENNLKRIRKDFQWEKVTEQYLELFEGLLSPVG
jgi:glycosyltransferase involved in cell wall biosynthesis